MSAAAGPPLPEETFAGHLFPRLLRFVLALLLAASAVLLAG